MTKVKYLIITLLSIFILFISSKTVNATNISYKTEYYSSIDTAVYVSGLNNNLEDGYSYYIYITRDTSTDVETILEKARFAQCDSLKYDSENNQFYLKNNAYNMGIFEKSGDYYAYIVKGKVPDKGTFTLIDGPTKLERPSLLPNGQRITAYFSQNMFSYYISQYNYYTKMFNTDRKVDFYLGKIEDTSLLSKLSNKSSDAYDVLYTYAQTNNNYVYSGSFDTTSTGVLDYNILKDFSGLKTGENYFIYFKLDDENGTYATMDDVQAYTVNKLRILDKFSASSSINNNTNNTTNSNSTTTSPVTSNSSVKNEANKTDKTTQGGVLPHTGEEIKLFILLICILLITGLFTYFKYNKIKDV